MDARFVNIYDNEDEIISTLNEKISRIANDAIEDRGIFTIGLSGGSLVNLLAKAFPKLTTDFSKWKFFFCDERLVSFNDPESTYGLYKKLLLPAIDITEDQFVVVNPELSVEDAAKDYIQKLAVYFPPNEHPRFDTLLLGMGPDGHTCSLFPGHRLLQETSVWVAPITNSPKPPSCRITITFPVINNALLCIFVVQGDGKAKMVKRILKDKEDLPAGRVLPTDGEVYWLLDRKAASLL